MKELILTYKNTTFKCFVDDEDYDKVVEAGPWYVTGFGYANNKFMTMQNFIMCPPEGFVVDHANHDKLDNQKSNLRICTKSQNLCNRKEQSNNISGFKGVSLRREGAWFARIQVNGKSVSLGVFPSPEEAARRYDRAALYYHGKFAYTNYPRSDYQ